LASNAINIECHPFFAIAMKKIAPTPSLQPKNMIAEKVVLL
jgi:hypothetical protein